MERHDTNQLEDNLLDDECVDTNSSMDATSNNAPEIIVISSSESSRDSATDPEPIPEQSTSHSEDIRGNVLLERFLNSGSPKMTITKEFTCCSFNPDGFTMYQIIKTEVKPAPEPVPEESTEIDEAENIENRPKKSDDPNGKNDDTESDPDIIELD